MPCTPKPSGWSSGSGTVSHSASTVPLPLGAFSAARKRLVRPISLSAASAANVSSVATWAFQPKRPTRSVPGSSRGATRWARPLRPAGGVVSRARMSASSRASTRPAPKSGVVSRWAVTLACGGTTSRHSAAMASACSNEPPRAASGSKGSGGSAARPKRVTRLALEPPTRGRAWQAAQEWSFMIGPRPSAATRVRSNWALPSAKRCSSAAPRPGSGSPMRGWTGCCAAAESARAAVPASNRERGALTGRSSGRGRSRSCSRPGRPWGPRRRAARSGSCPAPRPRTPGRPSRRRGWPGRRRPP